MPESIFSAAHALIISLLQRPVERGDPQPGSVAPFFGEAVGRVMSADERKRGFLETVIEESVETVRKASTKDFDKVKLILTDFILVASSGPILDEDARLFARKMLNEHRQATVLGLWKKSSLLNAIMANAFSAHSLELDDWLSVGFFHASATIVPPLLAHGEVYSHTLEEVAEAVMFGYEVGARIGSFFGKQHFRAWHPTSTIGGIASASSLAYLKHDGSVEDIEKVAAFSLGYASGIWKVIMSDVYLKPFSAVHAAFLAHISNESIDVIKKPAGELLSRDGAICRLLNAECSYERALNVPWRLAIEETSIKLYPVARNIQTAIQACDKIRPLLSGKEIEKVKIEIYEEAYQVADLENPQTVDEAKFSLKFAVSLSLLEEINGLKSLATGLRNPRVRELEKRVEVRTREDFSLMYPLKQPVRVEVTTKGGETFEAYEDEPIGSISSNSSQRLVERKAKMLSNDTGDLRLLVIPRVIMGASLNETIGSFLEKLL